MSPLAKFFRTFAASMVGVLGAAVVAAQASDFNAGLVALTIGVVAALLAGLVSALQAFAGRAPATPIGKGIATTLQFLAAGLATIVVADLSDVTNLPRLLLPLVVAAVLAGLQTFAQNSAEGDVTPA